MAQCSQPQCQTTAGCKCYATTLYREWEVVRRTLELHEARCSPEAVYNTREQARAEIEGREPVFLPAVCRG